jgi:hypothetical protein
MTVTRRLLLSGFVCLVIVVLTHIAEMLNVFPGMGWACQTVPVITSISSVRCLAACF